MEGIIDRTGNQTSLMHDLLEKFMDGVELSVEELKLLKDLVAKHLDKNASQEVAQGEQKEG